MRLDGNYEEIDIEGIDTIFMSLMYHDGSKLLVDIESSQLLLWYNYDEDYEEWFLVKSNEENIHKYMTSKMSLLEIIKTSNVFMGIRENDDYYSIKNLKKIVDLDDYELPAFDLFLGDN